MYWTNRSDECWILLAVEPLKSSLKVRPLGETLLGRNGQLFLSLVGEFDLGQAAIRKELARVKQIEYIQIGLRFISHQVI